MLNSMTGFGRAELENDERKIVVEIKSVNHRFLDFNIRMPRKYICLEDRIRKAIQKDIARGHLDVFVTVDSKMSSVKNIKVDKGLARDYYNEITALQKELAFERPITIQALIGLPDVLKCEEVTEDTEEFWLTLDPVIKEAVVSLNNMRQTEGTELQAGIKSNLVQIAAIRQKVSQRAPVVVEQYRNKLKNRLADLLVDNTIDENRLLAEVAVFADRADINEELVRLDSHLQQFADIMDLSEPVGRKLDFLNQEMFREVNTIGSKANDAVIGSLVVALKSEVEKIKEQIQNIE